MFAIRTIAAEGRFCKWYNKCIMKIYIGADHRGFNLKEAIKKQLAAQGKEVVDMGAAAYDKDDDFPDYAKRVAEKIGEDPDGRGIVICGAGFGVDIAANRFRGVRSALALSPEHITAGRHDDDVNVLALPADFFNEAQALAIVEKFLSTPFGTDARYARRIGKIDA